MGEVDRAFGFLNEAPGRAGRARAAVEEEFRPTVIGLVEAVASVERDRYRDDLDIAAQHRADMAERGIAPRLGRQHLGA